MLLLPSGRVLVAGFGLALVATAAFAAYEGPRAIHAPGIGTPPEVAGSGLAPEAAVKISIDARGSVTGVEVVSISPSSEFDEVFRKNLVDLISTWRFAPARRDETPEASTLDWRVRFPTRPGAEAMQTDADSALPGGDAVERRAAVLALPEEKRAQLLGAQVRVARALLDSGRLKTASTARFVVHTDADDAGVAEAVGNNLEVIFNLLASELLPGMPLQPERYKIQVIVCRDQRTYMRLLGELPMYEWSSGYYSPAGMIAFHLEQPSSDAVMGVLLHEGTHAFIDRHVVRPGLHFPRWLDEGFADYVGSSTIDKGKLRPGKTLARRFAFERGRLVDLQTRAGRDLELARDALKSGEGLGVAAMLDASPELFYGERRSLYYASSWLLVHFLRDGEEGWARGRFPQLMLYVAEGYPAPEAFRTLYGPVDAADAAFRRYVRKF